MQSTVEVVFLKINCNLKIKEKLKNFVGNCVVSGQVCPSKSHNNKATLPEMMSFLAIHHML